MTTIVNYGTIRLTVVVNHDLKGKNSKMGEITRLMDHTGSEKINRIINTAFKEFSLNGYVKASTNEIVKSAEISKGLLFHYFGSKQNLYDELIDFAFEYTMITIQENMNFRERDFFQRLKRILQIRIAVSKDYPYIFDFLSVVSKENSKDDRTGSFLKENMDFIEKIYSFNIDLSLFRTDIEIDQAINIVRWTFEKILEGEQSDQEKREEGEKYIRTLRSLLYNEE